MATALRELGQVAVVEQSDGPDDRVTVLIWDPHPQLLHPLVLLWPVGQEHLLVGMDVRPGVDADTVGVVAAHLEDVLLGGADGAPGVPALVATLGQPEVATVPAVQSEVRKSFLF